MQLASAIAAVLAVACAGDAPTATRVVEKTEAAFPAGVVPEGVRLLADVLGSCHTVSDGTVPHTAADVREARRGDHVRFAFPKPLKVDVRSGKVDVSEAVYAGGAFWLVCGDEVVRCSKYAPDKWEPFAKWYRQSLPTD